MGFRSYLTKKAGLPNDTQKLKCSKVIFETEEGTVTIDNPTVMTYTVQGYKLYTLSAPTIIEGIKMEFKDELEKVKDELAKNKNK